MWNNLFPRQYMSQLPMFTDFAQKVKTTLSRQEGQEREQLRQQKSKDSSGLATNPAGRQRLNVPEPFQTIHKLFPDGDRPNSQSLGRYVNQASSYAKLTPNFVFAPYQISSGWCCFQPYTQQDGSQTRIEQGSFLFHFIHAISVGLAELLRQQVQATL